MDAKVYQSKREGKGFAEIALTLGITAAEAAAAMRRESLRRHAVSMGRV